MSIALSMTTVTSTRSSGVSATCSLMADHQGSTLRQPTYGCLTLGGSGIRP